MPNPNPANPMPVGLVPPPEPIPAETVAPSTDPAADLPVTVIQPRRAWALADVGDLWRSRELLVNLVFRDVRLRYKQTILGPAWTLFQPIATVVVFAVFLGRVGGVDKGVDNYPLFVLAGMLPWLFFSNGVSTGANSLVANEKLVTKTYFPRLLLPASCIGAALFDFLVGLVLLAGWVIFAGVPLTAGLLLAPVVVGLLAVAATGFAVLGAALVVAQRDFRHALQFGMQLWMFATSCIYLPTDRIPAAAQAWLPLNPAYGLVLNFRAAVLGTPFDWAALAVSSAVGAVVLLAGLLYFHRVEETMADTI